MDPNTQKVALPAYLNKRLNAFRMGREPKQVYLLRDSFAKKTYEFEPWQFFILEVLPGCEDFAKLASVFEDRFGRPLTQGQLDKLLASLADKNLIDDSADHVLLKPYLVKRYETAGGEAVVKSFHAVAGSGSAGALPDIPPENESAIRPEEETVRELPAGVHDAFGLDERAARKIWTLFDPTPLLKVLSPVVAPLRFVIYPLPFIAAFAFYTAFRHRYLIVEDLTRLLQDMTFFEHAVYSMFSVNLLVTFTVAFTAHRYRATVTAFGIGIFFGFFPRFVTRVSHVEQLSRGERMWLHAGPLLMRLTLCTIGILLWFNTRDTNGLLPIMGLALAMISSIGLLFSANPLVKGSGYHLLSAFVDEPKLRGKAYKTLLNKIRGNVYQETDTTVLAAYALATLTFMFIMLVVAVMIFGHWLQTLKLGGAAIVMTALLGLLLLQRNVRYFKRIDEAYERSLRFDRWRTRTLPKPVDSQSEKDDTKGGWPVYAKRMILFGLFIAMFLPYRYDAGGQFVVFPGERQVIATDVAGVIDEVYFDGGETLAKGTVIARLAYGDYQSQFDFYTAKLEEQQAVIDELRSRPKPEEVALAKTALVVAQTREEFSKSKLTRIEDLYNEGAVSFEEFAALQREHSVDLNQVAERKAALDLVMAGATSYEIEAAQSKWQSLKEEQKSFKDKIDRSVLVMPFDGTLLTLHLKQKTNSYLEKGAPFAVAENSDQVTIEIEVPETEIGYVVPAAAVRIRPTSYHDDALSGFVKTIDGNVTPKSFGNVVKVVALVDNSEGKLKTGMTGYAKVEGPTLPVWKVFSLAVMRFVKVQVWSWLP